MTPKNKNLFTLPRSSVFAKAGTPLAVVDAGKISLNRESIANLLMAVYGLSSMEDVMKYATSIESLIEKNREDGVTSLSVSVYESQNSISSLTALSEELSCDLSTLISIANRTIHTVNSLSEAEENSTDIFGLYLVPIKKNDPTKGKKEYIFIPPVGYDSYHNTKTLGELKTLGGDWEMVGTTTFDDSEINKKIDDAYGDLMQTLATNLGMLRTALLNQISTLSNDVQTKYNDLTTDISNLNAALELSVDTINDKYNDLKNDYIDFTAEVTGTITQFVEAVTNDLNTAKADLKNYTDEKTNAIDANVNSLTEVVNGHTQEIETVAQAASFAVEQVTNLSGSLSGLPETVNTVSEALVETDNKIESLKNSIDEAISNNCSAELWWYADDDTEEHKAEVIDTLTIEDLIKYVRSLHKTILELKGTQP